MYNPNKYNPDKLDIPPLRLDLKTRISLMASIIFGTREWPNSSPGGEVDLAVNAAIRIEDAVEKAVQKKKNDNPIHRREVLK